MTGGADSLTGTGDLVKSEGMNSSTMKGPKGLAGKLSGRRCQTAKGLC